MSTNLWFHCGKCCSQIEAQGAHPSLRPAQGGEEPRTTAVADGPLLFCPQGPYPPGSLFSSSFSVGRLLGFDAEPLRPVERCLGPKGGS